VLEIESLPEHPEADAGPEPASEAAPDMADSTEAPTQRVRRARRAAAQAEKNGKLTGSSRADAAEKAAAEKAATEKLAAEKAAADKAATARKENGKEKAGAEATPDKPAGAPKADCDPPWYIDAKGIQRLKPKCL
jgi:colicin import membrane protein